MLSRRLSCTHDKQAANAANAAAYAAAAKDRKDIIPIVSPVEEVIAQGLVSLAIAGDIISEGSPEQVAAAGTLPFYSKARDAA